MAIAIFLFVTAVALAIVGLNYATREEATTANTAMLNSPI